MSKFLIPILVFLGLSCSKLDVLAPAQKSDSKSMSQSKERSSHTAKKVEIHKLDKQTVKTEVDHYNDRGQKKENSSRVDSFCRTLDKYFLHWGWGLSQCQGYSWNNVRTSVKQHPLIWMVYGNERDHTEKNYDLTMILCGVHADEITPIKFCFDVLDYLDKNFNREEFKEKVVVVAPIVNPDGFFKERPTRTNIRGVDLNRNFPTNDWQANALKSWKNRYRSDKRRYPGKYAMSEPESLFQVNLIKRYQPDKIISVHAPLTMLDYDGPKAALHTGGLVGSKANQLLINMSKMANGYRIKNYPYFPGSLGNFAGKERNIPTYTLELPSSDNRRSDEFWQLFKQAIRQAIVHDLRKDIDLADAEEPGLSTEN